MGYLLYTCHLGLQPAYPTVSKLSCVPLAFDLVCHSLNVLLSVRFLSSTGSTRKATEIVMSSAILLPNTIGGTCCGLNFVRSSLSALYSLDWPTILAGLWESTFYSERIIHKIPHGVPRTSLQMVFRYDTPPRTKSFEWFIM